MKCYIDALEGKDKEAVAVCQVCGMGVCFDHQVREEIEIYAGGYPFPTQKSGKPMPRILCTWCYESFKSLE